MNETTETIELEVQGDGTALESKPISSEGLQTVTSSKGTVKAWLPDPDNDENTIFWVVNAGDDTSPGTTVTLTLTYSGE
jgi:hypothetical protein